MMMTVKSWSVDEAMRAQEEAETRGLNSSNPTGPIYQWAALHELDEHEIRFRAGDKMALFDAIALCARCGLCFPDWTATAFLAGWRQIVSAKVGSLDEAFGRPHRKGTHLRSVRQRRELRFAVWTYVRELRRGETQPALDDGLFEAAGERFEIGKTLAKDLYYGVDKVLGRK